MSSKIYSFDDATRVIPAPTFDELQSRIQAVTQYYGGKLPKEHALAWVGYLAALTEWQLIRNSDHSKLLDLLGDPKERPIAPALMIFLGPEGAAETMEKEGIKDQRLSPGTRVAS